MSQANGLWSPVSYTYAPSGTQKVLQQTKRRGRRLNMLGLYSKGVSFDYGLKLGSFKGNSYIQLLKSASTTSRQKISTDRTNYGYCPR